MQRQFRIYFLLILVLLGACTAQAATQMELITALGYKDSVKAPLILLGANLKSAGKNSGLTLHLSNVLVPGTELSTVTVGAELELWYMKPLVYYATIKSSAYVRQQADKLNQSYTIEGQGSFGSVTGSVTLGYVESHLSIFPWECEAVTNGIMEDIPYYFLEAGVAANVVHSWGLKWSQDVAFRTHVNENGYRLGLSTGPEIKLGPGALTLQGGFVLSATGIRPMGKLRFEIRDPYEGDKELRIEAITTSLGRNVPVYQGWYSLDRERWRFQALIRLEHPIEGKSNPTLYISVAPKF
ncbi:MAG TPA: hypothetical protein GXZ82_11575 [Firmicutes bacterium]|nr:hypothetical protein [Bacillota bacterium]